MSVNPKIGQWGMVWFLMASFKTDMCILTLLSEKKTWYIFLVLHSHGHLALKNTWKGVIDRFVITPQANNIHIQWKIYDISENQFEEPMLVISDFIRVSIRTPMVFKYLLWFLFQLYRKHDHPKGNDSIDEDEAFWLELSQTYSVHHTPTISDVSLPQRTNREKAKA